MLSHSELMRSVLLQAGFFRHCYCFTAYYILLCIPFLFGLFIFFRKRMEIFRGIGMLVIGIAFISLIPYFTCAYIAYFHCLKGFNLLGGVSVEQIQNARIQFELFFLNRTCIILVSLFMILVTFKSVCSISRRERDSEKSSDANLE